MKKYSTIVSIASIFLGIASIAHAWRTSVSSVWAAKAVQIDARSTEWSEWPVLEDDGVAIRAMNDGSNLYLLFRGANDDGRMILSGKFNQSLTLLFFKSDHKTKAWAINFDFAHGHSPDVTVNPPTLAAFGIVPQLLKFDGAIVSTTPLPSEISLETDLSTELGRQPMYELRIPLNLLDAKSRSIFADLTTSDITLETRTNYLAGKTDSPPPPKGDAAADGAHHHPDGGASHPTDLPKSLHMHLTFDLAKP